MKRLTFFMVLIALAGCHRGNRPQGISVGNGNTSTDTPRAAKSITYVSPYRFRLSYADTLELEKDETQKNVTITNRKLLAAGSPASQVKLEVIRRGDDFPGFAARTAATGRHLDGLKTFLKRKHPELEWKRVEFPSAHGFTSATTTPTGANAKSYLLTGNLDLVILSLEAHAAGRGMEWVAPIVETFTGDPEPPYVTSVRIETAALSVGGNSRLVFKALDPSGISLSVPKQGVIIDRPAVKSIEDRSMPIELESTFQAIGNDEYALSFKVGAFAGRGAYVVKKLSVADKAGNVQTLLTSDDAASLPLASFSVDNAAGDVTPPVFSNVTIDKTEIVKAGDSLVVHLELEETGSGMALGDGAGCVVLARFRTRGTEANERLCGKLELGKEIEGPKELVKAGAKDFVPYRLSVKTGPTWQTGSFDLLRVVVWDKAGNAGIFEPPKIDTTHPGPRAMGFAPGTGPAAVTAAPALKGMPAFEALAARAPFSFAVSNELGGDEIGPVIRAMSFEPSAVAAGSATVATIEATDIGSGVALGDVKVWFRSADGDEELPDVLLRGKLEKIADNRFRLPLASSPWALPGRYVVKTLELRDRVGNTATWLSPIPRPELTIK